MYIMNLPLLHKGCNNPRQLTRLTRYAVMGLESQKSYLHTETLHPKTEIRFPIEVQSPVCCKKEASLYCLNNRNLLACLIFSG